MDTYIKQYRYTYPILLVIIGVLVYFPVLRNQLLDFWDDQWAVMNRYTEGGINFQNGWAILTEYYHGQYAPLNEYLYLVLYTFFGYNPMPYHLTSLLLHVGNTCLVYFVMKKLLVMSNRMKAENIGIVSFFTALIFCIHPFNVESVCWMSASKVPLYALFYLGATYTFLIYLKKKKISYYICTVFLYILSFLGKDQAVTFPLWMLLIYWLLNYKLKEKSIWLVTLPFFVLSVLFGIVTMFSQSATGQGILSEESTYPLWQRLVYGCYSLIEYLTKTLVPVKLSYMYPFPVPVGDPLPNWLLVYPALLIIITATLWRYIARNWVLVFGLLFFLIHIALVVNVVSLSRFSMIADRYVYMAMIGISFIISYYFIQARQKLTKNRRLILAGLFAGYLLCMGVYSNLRTRTWYNTDSLKKEIRDLLKQRDDYNHNKEHGQH